MGSKSVPEVRFKGFSGEWDECKIVDVLNINSGRDYKHLKKGDIPVYGTGGYMHSVNDKLSNDDAIGIGRKGTINKPQLLLAPFWTVDTLFYMTVKGENDLYFLYSLANRIDWKKYDESTGVPSLSKNSIYKISINVPLLREQTRIGNFFKQLDETITIQQQELDTLKQTKQGFLQKMFPKEGESLPEIRFPGFSGEWEKSKLNDIGIVEMCKRIFKNQTTVVGDIPFYKIGTFGRKADSFISRELFEEYKSKYPFPEVGDILISASGTIGRTVVYNGEDAYYQDSNIVWLKPNKDRVKNCFLQQFYQIVKWHGTEGSTIKRLYNSKIRETEIYLPSINEQELIGRFFNRLDNTIFIHEQELETLLETKKAFLQKMFV
ncbi:restriction endonuclease subunit S [Bacillus altitudinis]|uniref:restriction endonuclease subunit S n=1 Tax=Bacillus altitudinis TaxID=293387 RepID=UPI0024C1EBC7|nr:restriction endonuclease subunit S [Bacillus altitudinis]WHY04445.1 restriction endonuclease subunit S [Bacillus altitudinis]